jgi:hypothetical protein
MKSPCGGERFCLSIVFYRPFGAGFPTKPSRGPRASRLPRAEIFGLRGLKSNFATETSYLISALGVACR